MNIYDFILNLLKIIWNVFAIIGIGTTIFLLTNIIKAFFTYKDLVRIEKSYSQALKFIREDLGEISYVLNKLPEEIIVERAYKGERTISSRLFTLLKKGRGKLLGKQYMDIIIFSDLSYPEQIAYMIQKVFESIFPYEKVLKAEFRDSIITYYAYKFAVKSKQLITREVIDILERRFQSTKHADLIIKLDSKHLEEKITLNPPPEVRPILDRVIIPILDLKRHEMEKEKDIATIESAKNEMEKILTAIGNGKIALLFIGKKEPSTYLDYVKQKLIWYNGLLVCVRGKYVIIYEKYIRNKLTDIFKETFGIEPETKQFKGKLTVKESEKIYYKYELLISLNN